MRQLNVGCGKKSQFKIQQMAFMLVAVILFFGLAGMFFLIVSYRDIHQQATQLELNKVVLMAGFLAGTSEFSCASDIGQYCIDTDKLIILKNKTVYSGFWPVAYIKVRKVYSAQVKEIIESRGILNETINKNITSQNITEENITINVNGRNVTIRNITRKYEETAESKGTKAEEKKEEKDVDCNKVSYPNCDVYNVYENKKIKASSSASSFVALCRWEKVNSYATRVCELGKIIIGYEIK